MCEGLITCLHVCAHSSLCISACHLLKKLQLFWNEASSLCRGLTFSSVPMKSMEKLFIIYEEICRMCVYPCTHQSNQWLFREKYYIISSIYQNVCGGECGGGAAAREREVERAHESSTRWVIGRAGTRLVITVFLYMQWCAGTQMGDAGEMQMETNRRTRRVRSPEAHYCVK